MADMMLTLLAAIVITMLHSTSAIGERFEVEYYTNVSLPCNYTLHNAGYPGIAIPFKRYWILPNSSVVPDSFINTAERMYVDRPTPYDFNLVILNVDDEDFGVFHCVMIWNNIDYAATAIPVGLNEDGPLYKKQLEEFQSNVLIGGIIAGGVVLIVFAICIVYYCRLRRKHRDQSFDDDITYQASDDIATKYGYGGENRKRPSEFVTSRPPAETPNDPETGVYAKVEKSRISSCRSSSSQTDVVTEQSVHL